MNREIYRFAARLRDLIGNPQSAISNPQFADLALELFALQYGQNPVYRNICAARNLTPPVVGHWTQIPAVPAAAFKELSLTSLAPDESTTIFHSSGTTGQKSSRHFHSAESLALYEASLWSWFEQHLLQASGLKFQVIALTPPPELAPHSSLVHMFETVRQKLGAAKSAFVGKLAVDGSWALDLEATLDALSPAPLRAPRAALLLGTAFTFVHLLDYLVEQDFRLELPAGSCVIETGGYKNRARALPKSELHALITERLGVPGENIICEYGMSELSSQAYDTAKNSPASVHYPRVFHFPPWARVQIISPESGREVAEVETGVIRIFDLANVFSVAAIQTEDLGIRRGDGFELVGRAQLAEPRGCSLMAA